MSVRATSPHSDPLCLAPFEHAHASNLRIALYASVYVHYVVPIYDTIGNYVRTMKPVQRVA